MKKVILAIAAMVLTAGMISAQDMAQATELYNNGATLQERGILPSRPLLRCHIQLLP